jgi:glycosidase
MLAIDRVLGDEADLRAFVDDVHRRGMRILMDWTLNRASVDCRLAQLRPDWFTRDAQGRPYYAVPNRDYFIGYDFSNRELREYLICNMVLWVERFGFDGLRFDDSDITPVDFLEEIRAALAAVRPDIVLLSQAYDEFHHLAACDLTYDGGLRDAMLAMHAGAGPDTVRRYWENATYHFPRGALRMRWLDDKEQDRIFRRIGPDAHRAAATLAMMLDGVPLILMGQEYNEPRWNTWSVLFDGFTPDRSAFDHATHAHYRALIALRKTRPELRDGAVSFVASPDLVMFRRGEALLICVNCSAQPVALPAIARAAHPLYAQGLHDGMLAPWGSLIAS